MNGSSLARRQRSRIRLSLYQLILFAVVLATARGMRPLPAQVVATMPSSEAAPNSETAPASETRASGAAKTIARVLGGRSEARKLQAIALLEQNVRQRIAVHRELIRIARANADKATGVNEIPASTYPLIRLLGSIERPATEECLIELLDCKRTEIAMASADALGEFRRFGAIEALKKQTERPEYESSYGFRFNLIRALLRMRHPDALEVLGQWEPQLDGQLEYETERLLDEVTVDDFRGDQARFQAWQEATGRARTSEPMKLASSSGSQGRMRLQPSYYGLPIHANRLVFVLDCSGSMNERTYRGNRLSDAKRELVATITSLPSDSEFTIVAYNELIRPWRSELTVATEENKAKAFQFINGLGCGKATDTYGALRHAFDLSSNLEAIYLLSDGRPNRGAITVPKLIVQDLTARNRLRHLTINTIGIGVAGPTEHFMRALAHQHSGEFRAVD